MRVDALLELYKAEKEQLDDPLFGEPFPSFKKWVAQIRVDQGETHRTVDTNTADKLADRAVKTAESDLTKEVTKQKEPSPPTKSPTPKKKVGRKSRRMSKVDKARNIYARFYQTKTRKEIISKFVAQCNLSQAGAATYYQKFK